jgi:hypothetical protein
MIVVPFRQSTVTLRTAADVGRRIRRQKTPAQPDLTATWLHADAMRCRMHRFSPLRSAHRQLQRNIERRVPDPDDDHVLIGIG